MFFLGNNMKKIISAIFSIPLLFSLANTSYANKLSFDDGTKLLDATKGLIDFNADVAKISNAALNSPAGLSQIDSRKTVVCLARVSGVGSDTLLYLFGAQYAVRVASMITDPLDELAVLDLIRTALSQSINSVVSSKEELLKISGTCGQNPAAYDKAKTLIRLLDVVDRSLRAIIQKIVN
jgi:hypothetical protein